VDGEHWVVGVVSESDLLSKGEFRDGDPDRVPALWRLPDLARAGARVAGAGQATPGGFRTSARP
jgi:hypothetical protein